MQRLRVGDRVPAVEGVGDVDEPALLPDRRQRVRERHAPRDLLVQEEPDHLALALGLHLFAGDHDRAPGRGASSTASCAPANTLWSVTAIAPSPSASRMVEELGDGDRAVVRPARVHVQVGDDPVAVGERVGRAGSRGGAARATRRSARARAATASNDSPSARAGRALASRSRKPASSIRRATAAAASSGWSLTPGGSAIAHPTPSPRAGAERCHRARGRGSPPRARSGGPGLGPHERAHVHAVATACGIVGARRAASCGRARPPSPGARAARASPPRATASALARTSTAITFASARRVPGRCPRPARRRDSHREALGRGRGDALRGREQRVDARRAGGRAGHARVG